MNSDEKLERVLPMSTVQAVTGVSKSTIYLWIKSRTFPRQVKLGSRSGWLESEIQQWVRDKAANRPD